MSSDDKTRVVKPSGDAAAGDGGRQPAAASPPQPSVETAINKVPVKKGGKATKRVPVGAQIVNQGSDPDATRLPDPDATRVPEAKAEAVAAEKTRLVRAPAEAENAGGRGAAQAGPEQPHDTTIKGRFVLQQLVGAGGMGAVYKALDKRKVEAKDRDPYVAIKVLNEDFRRHPDSIISLQRESRKSQILAHPNIVNVHDFDRDGELVYMTMEYLEGAPLDKLIKEHSSGIKRAEGLKIIRDVATALSYAHSHDIVHSDFKPGNIFVTRKGVGKVFDFGIARAVTKSRLDADTEAGPREKTWFDAGSLGALTPAYASLQMLQGEEPSTSDDVYALGCVAYEVLSGRHPFDKKPADKAREQGLKPARLAHVSRRQWRALESALAFERRDRTEHVDRFIDDFFGKKRSPLWLVAGAVVLAGVAVLTYLQVQQREEQLRQELETREQGRLQQQQQQHLQERLAALLQQRDLSAEWEEQFSALLLEYKTEAPADIAGVATYERQVAESYLEAAAQLRQQGELDRAAQLLDRAKRWEPEANQLSAEAERIAEARQLEAESLAAARREAREEEIRLAEKRRQLEADIAQQKQREQYQQALRGVRSALSCSSSLQLGSAVERRIADFKARYPAQYRQQQPQLVAGLADCVRSRAARDPAAADTLKAAALALFPAQQSLAAIKIDYCGHLDPGGGRSCRDPLRSGAAAAGRRGPAMVVIPPLAAGGAALAVSKYEISVGEVNRFCQASETCEISNKNSGLPAHDISADTARGFARWLSEATGFSYRLPSRREWLAAASGRDKAEDPNRNCYIRFGGIEKGVKLMKVNTGRGNSFGVVNYSGNVQEWVIDNGELAAAGSHHRDPMSRCTLDSLRAHDGSADAMTGFRVVRTIE